MFFFTHGNFKNTKIILLIFLSMLFIKKVDCLVTNEIVESALSTISEEYLLLNYNFLPKRINDFNYKAENINVDILLETGDILLENAKKFFFKFNEFDYTIIPKKYKKKFLNIESTKNYAMLYNCDRKINIAITYLLKTALEYYKSALFICNSIETQKDIIVQFNVVITEMRHMLMYVTKEKYQKEFMHLINNYESDLDAFKIKKNFLEIRSEPSLSSYKKN